MERPLVVAASCMETLLGRRVTWARNSRVVTSRSRPAAVCRARGRLGRRSSAVTAAPECAWHALRPRAADGSADASRRRRTRSRHRDARRAARALRPTRDVAPPWFGAAWPAHVRGLGRRNRRARRQASPRLSLASRTRRFVDGTTTTCDGACWRCVAKATPHRQRCRPVPAARPLTGTLVALPAGLMWGYDAWLARRGAETRQRGAATTDATHASTARSSTGSGTAPWSSTTPWNWRMSNRAPSFCFARSRSSMIFNSPIM